MKTLADIRRDYQLAELDRKDLLDDPIQQFDRWLQDTIDAGIPDPTAMTIATVDADGQPSQRIVLLKDVSQNGFVFYTNTQSRKAQELAANNRISLHFPWHFMERQVKVCGKVEPMSTVEVAKYFMSRPKESQLAAWASEQSKPVSTRQLLMSKFEEVKKKFADGQIPLPSFWGGYRVIPHEIEFWQGGANRLHNRFSYQKQQDGAWVIERLMP
ncbi:pyridoxamine 5'-phosphate oxidase [Aestuariibacter sp. AA17]|uniref:Pyridoxine/pyridoxamine 5'-phosphate oxidase n=1 Tax=Fluctibacter corallii TaxID=2984329 RepID=A0ABT3A3I8_9ALTE|nr:pyridoxamine 5'-phosphate oxidase [Aestuariibacter sp. AA17]MCV2883242.1 pyridoxamine 5'-phosphate oxidase [Aestuariibacter sp. AA17]